MEKQFSQEQIEKARACKSVEELLALAKEAGTELTEAEAINLFAQLHPENGELSDSELEVVSGGCGGEVCQHDLEDTGEEGPGLLCILHKFKCKKCGHTEYLTPDLV